MTNVYNMSGVSTGLSRVAKHERGRDLRDTQLAEAKSRKQLAESQLAEHQQRAPLRKSQADVQMAQAQQQLYNTNAQMLETQTYDAFQRYDQDGDSKHLNFFLEQSKKNPLAHAAKNYSRISSLAESRSSETDNLLRQAGVTDIEGAYANEDFASSHLVATGMDGKLSILDYNQLKGSTRYNQYASKQQLETQERQAKIASMLRQGGTQAKIEQLDKLAKVFMKEQPELSASESYKKAQNTLDGSAGSSDERQINRIVEESNGNLSYLEATNQYYSAKRSGSGQTNEASFVESYMAENPDADEVEATTAYKNLGRTAKSKDVAEVNTLRDDLDGMNYLETADTELSPTQKAQAQRKVFDIIKLGGYDLGNEEKRALRGLRQMLTFGGTVADKLTSEQTGFMDSFLNKTKSYLSDEVKGKAATAAYESFRNVLRHDLFGATVPEGEMAAFNASVGSLGKQTGPVLAMMREQINGMKAKIQSIADTNEPYVARHFLGVDLDSTDALIEKLDLRLDALQGKLKGTKPTVVKPRSTSEKITQTTGVHVPGAEKPSLDSLFGPK